MATVQLVEVVVDVDEADEMQVDVLLALDHARFALFGNGIVGRGHVHGVFEVLGALFGRHQFRCFEKLSQRFVR